MTPFLDDLKAFLPVPVKGLARPMAPIPSSSSLSSATARMARSLALVTGEKSSLVGAKPAGEPRSAPLESAKSSAACAPPTTPPPTVCASVGIAGGGIAAASAVCCACVATD